MSHTDELLEAFFAIVRLIFWVVVFAGIAALIVGIARAIIHGLSVFGI